ncbi:hypothetical protein QVD17_15743 [Tagetes erecta]|uniref:Uncharacterized protein n=1 Tax=Tagetes erecta TaxID=13708 RepID=A0AAD8KWI6_TARER|nr:hypothetical protein QVD17_15743 [Tagetes erecta]
MEDTILHHISTVEKFLLSSTTFWSSLSTAALIGAISSFYSTQQYSFNVSSIYIVTPLIALHLIIFFSNPKTLKTTFAPFFPGSALKWAIRITAIRIGYMLHSAPEQSVLGLICVICVWVDGIAISRIIRPSVGYWFANAVFTAIVGRTEELYGFSGRYWLVMMLCFPLIYVQVRLEGYKSDETSDEVEKKEE